MSRYVLDASALLASLHNEPGSDVVDPLLPECTISTVNLAEVIQKAIQQGIPTNTLVSDLQILGVQIMDYTLEHADLTRQEGDIDVNLRDP